MLVFVDTVNYNSESEPPLILTRSWAYLYLYNELDVETTHRQRRHAVLCVLWSRRSNFGRQVGRPVEATDLRPQETGNGSQVFTASMLTVLRFISLTDGLAVGSARVTDLSSSMYKRHTVPVGFVLWCGLVLFKGISLSRIVPLQAVAIYETIIYDTSAYSCGLL